MIDDVPPRARAPQTSAPIDDGLLGEPEPTLLDVVDHVLNQGIVLTGDVMLSVANVDLVYLRLSALLCAADRLLEKK